MDWLKVVQRGFVSLQPIREMLFTAISFFIIIEKEEEEETSANRCSLIRCDLFT